MEECKCMRKEICKRMTDAALKKALEILKGLESSSDTLEANRRCGTAKGACKAIINALEKCKCVDGKNLRKEVKKTLKLLERDGRFKEEESAATKVLVAGISAFVQQSDQ